MHEITLNDTWIVTTPTEGSKRITDLKFFCELVKNDSYKGIDTIDIREPLHGMILGGSEIVISTDKEPLLPVEGVHSGLWHQWSLAEAILLIDLIIELKIYEQKNYLEIWIEESSQNSYRVLVLEFRNNTLFFQQYLMN